MSTSQYGGRITSISIEGYELTPGSPNEYITGDDLKYFLMGLMSLTEGSNLPAAEYSPEDLSFIEAMTNLAFLTDTFPPRAFGHLVHELEGEAVDGVVVTDVQRILQKLEQHMLYIQAEQERLREQANG